MRRKKLHLHRETLRTLDGGHLGRAAGGANTHELNTGCACTVGCGGSANCGTAGCGATAGCSGNTCTCINPLSHCVC